MDGPAREKNETSPLCMGLLAHVDAGKTTLSEAILYRTGAIRKLGRVDHGTSFLDNGTVERERGITVFSKEARFLTGTREVTLLDTPGHADFSAEAERTLSVLDLAILIVSGPDGVQSHTRTIWKLLDAYGIPVFVFVNKMDREGSDGNRVLAELKKDFGPGFVAFEKEGPADTGRSGLLHRGDDGGLSGDRPDLRKRHHCRHRKKKSLSCFFRRCP